MKKTPREIFRHVTRCWPSHHALIHLLMSVDQGIIGPYNACAVLVHYFNQWWFIECSTIRNKNQWNLNQNTTIFIQENNALCHMIHFTIIVNHMMHFVPCDPWELLCDVCSIMQWLLSPTQWWVGSARSATWSRSYGAWWQEAVGMTWIPYSYFDTCSQMWL